MYCYLISLYATSQKKYLVWLFQRKKLSCYTNTAKSIQPKGHLYRILLIIYTYRNSKTAKNKRARDPAYRQENKKAASAVGWQLWC